MQNVPFYQQVADTIRSRIAAGAYPVDECLPASAELEASFGVSNITIRKALAVLRDEGLIATKRGVGTVVLVGNEPARVDIHFSGSLGEWLEWASGKTQAVTQKVLGVDEDRGPSEVRDKLDLAPDEMMWRLRRLRSRRGEPISYHLTYGSTQLGVTVDARDLEGSGSFIELLQKHRPGDIAQIEQTVEARVADMDLARILKIEFGAPIFFMEHAYLALNGRALAITHMFMRADRYRYSTSVSV